MSEEKEVSATIIGGRITAIEGRKVTVETIDIFGKLAPVEYELADNSPFRPEDLIDYVGDYISIIVVNGKIYKIK